MKDLKAWVKELKKVKNLPELEEMKTAMMNKGEFKKAIEVQCQILRVRGII